MPSTNEEEQQKQLIGVNIPASSPAADEENKPEFIKPDEIKGFDRMTVYDYFINAILEPSKKIKRESLLSAIGDYQITLMAADALTSVLNSVCSADEEAGLYVPAYEGLPAIIRFRIPEEKQKDYAEWQIIDEGKFISIIVMGEDKQLKKLVFSHMIPLKNGVVNRKDNFTSENKYKFASHVFDIIEPRHIRKDVRKAELDKQNVINAALRAVIMAYVPESLTIRAIEATLLKEWETMNEEVKDVLLEQYGKDVYKSLKKSDSIHTSESKCLGDIISVLRTKLNRAYELLKAADNTQTTNQ